MLQLGQPHQAIAAFAPLKWCGRGLLIPLHKLSANQRRRFPRVDLDFSAFLYAVISCAWCPSRFLYKALLFPESKIPSFALIDCLRFDESSGRSHQKPGDYMQLKLFSFESPSVTAQWFSL
jgi:hypothetical protein